MSRGWWDSELEVWHPERCDCLRCRDHLFKMEQRRVRWESDEVVFIAALCIMVVAGIVTILFT